MTTTHGTRGWLYPAFLEAMWQGRINARSEWAVMLLTHASYNSAHTDIQCVSTWEVTGPGYEAGGATVGKLELVVEGRRVGWKVPEARWKNATFTALRFAIYDKGTGTLMLMGKFDLPLAPKNGTAIVGAPAPFPGFDLAGGDL